VTKKASLRVQCTSYGKSLKLQWNISKTLAAAAAISAQMRGVRPLESPEHDAAALGRIVNVPVAVRVHKARYG
jgi:hypothetical protein